MRGAIGGANPLAGCHPADSMSLAPRVTSSLATSPISLPPKRFSLASRSFARGHGSCFFRGEQGERARLRNGQTSLLPLASWERFEQAHQMSMSRPARKSLLCDAEERLRSVVLVRQRTGGIQTMHHEPVETTWSEVVTALAVLGIITFLLLL
jgi:hypothetical protein